VTDPRKIFVILLNWNQSALLRACLDSLIPVSSALHEILVVDNASTEEVDWDRFAARPPGFRLISNTDNLGFAGGNNVGISHALDAGADHVFLLNTDTVVDRDFLWPLVDVLDHQEGAAGVGPTIRYWGCEDRMWFAGAFFSTRKARPLQIFEMRKAVEADCAGVPTYYVPGCCLGARADVWRDVGLLADDYFFLWEDVDWCERAREKGYRHLWVPHSVIHHKVQYPYLLHESAPHRIYYEFRNRLFYCQRHLSVPIRHYAYAVVLLEWARTACLIARSGTPVRRSRWWGLWGGLWDFVAGRTGKIPVRWSDAGC